MRRAGRKRRQRRNALVAGGPFPGFLQFAVALLDHRRQPRDEVGRQARSHRQCHPHAPQVPREILAGMVVQFTRQWDVQDEQPGVAGDREDGEAPRPPRPQRHGGHGNQHQVEHAERIRRTTDEIEHGGDLRRVHQQRGAAERAGHRSVGVKPPRQPGIRRDRQRSQGQQRDDGQASTGEPLRHGDDQYLCSRLAPTDADQPARPDLVANVFGGLHDARGGGGPVAVSTRAVGRYVRYFVFSSIFVGVIQVLPSFAATVPVTTAGFSPVQTWPNFSDTAFLTT